MLIIGHNVWTFLAADDNETYFNYKAILHVSFMRMERVLGIDQGVRVFAPQHPTQKGRVLGQLWYSLKDNIDWFEARHMIKMSVAMENLALSKTRIANLCVYGIMDHFASDAIVFC